ncbi:MAG TPA: RNA-binding S4 domain-containing protein [Candidatus Synoicihabitans sp.]|nr:RNA-binding S4 domain-containing protein [Candidatus Synoicihabitans sp.]
MEPNASRPEKIAIRTATIELAQALKFAGLVGSGGDAKTAITNGLVSVNGQVELRRGRQLQEGDVVTYNDRSLRVARGP